jgi:hypothetical protein
MQTTIPIDTLFAGGRLGGGDIEAAHLTGRGVLHVPVRDVERMRKALDADARRGLLLAAIHRVSAPAWPTRAVAALAEGVGGPVGDHIAGRLRELADARGEAPLGPRARRLAGAMSAAAAGRRAAIEAARATLYDAALDGFHAVDPARNAVVSPDARRTQVRRPSDLER